MKQHAVTILCPNTFLVLNEAVKTEKLLYIVEVSNYN